MRQRVDDMTKLEWEAFDRFAWSLRKEMVRRKLRPCFTSATSNFYSILKDDKWVADFYYDDGKVFVKNENPRKKRVPFKNFAEGMKIYGQLKKCFDIYNGIVFFMCK